MPNRINLGVACLSPGERAALMQWLDEGGYEPVSLLDATRLVDDIAVRRMEALILDQGMLAPAEIPAIVRRLGMNRPLILVGSAGTAPSGAARDFSWLERPVTRSSLLLSVALALAEGRPVRRSPRRAIERVSSSVDGMDAHLLDVSSEGVRLEIAGTRQGTLPPYFTLRVPAYGIKASVKRVWITTPRQQAVWCGGIVERLLPGSQRTWATFAEQAPAMDSRLFR